MRVPLEKKDMRSRQIVEFRIAGELFGIDAEKVQELLLSTPVSTLSEVHPAVEGFFKHKNKALAVLNMSHCLIETPPEPAESDIFLVTKGAFQIALRVQSIEGICRADRSEPRPAETLPDGIREEAIAGELVCDDQSVLLPDYDRIFSEVEPLLIPKMEEDLRKKREQMCSLPLVIAEPVPLMAVYLRDALTKSGYKNLRIYSDGETLWDALCTFRDEETLKENAALVITALKTPRLKASDLIGRIRHDAVLQSLPVLTTALALGEDERKALREAGSDGEFSKEEFGDLAACVDRLLEKQFDFFAEN